LYDSQRDLISFPYYVDQFDEPPPDVKPGHGITEYVLRTGSSLLLPRNDLEELIRKGEVDQVGTLSIDWLGVPLRVAGQVIGVMVTQSYQEDIHFTPDDLQLFEFISSQVAQMIDRKRDEEKIRYMGIHDVLTGLYNRAFFDEELKRLERGRVFPISILMADLDDLKEINDREGHAAGDELLRQASQVMRTAFRQEDVVARIGGDEFSVLLPGIDADLAKKSMQRLIEMIDKYNNSLQGNPIRISLGVATADDGNSLLSALKSADEEMYLDKQSK
jgi:diguanylate cyclase (GGDEF)-like protein